VAELFETIDFDDERLSVIPSDKPPGVHQVDGSFAGEVGDGSALFIG